MASYTFERKDNHIELSFEGEVTLEQSFDFKDEIKEKIANENCYRMIVDLQKVPFMDSSGLGMLISFFKEINEKQGTIVYYGIHDYLKKLLALVKLDQVFTVCDDKEAALKELSI